MLSPPAPALARGEQVSSPDCCQQCNSPLLVIGEHRACENCGWHTPGFEQLQPKDIYSDLAESFRDVLETAAAQAEANVSESMRVFEAWRTHERSDQDLRLAAFRAKFLSKKLPRKTPEKASRKHAEPEKLNTLAQRVAEILKNPDHYPTMSYEETAHAVGKSQSTVRRWCDEKDGKLQRAKGGRVLTSSVIACLKGE